MVSGVGSPGELPDTDLLAVLEGLARQVLPGGETCDVVLLATTKGDVPRYTESIVNGSYAGNPADLAHELGRRLGAPAFAVSAACASGPVALGEAARRILSGHARRVLVLAGDRLGDFVRDGFAALQAVAADHCRPFDAERTGLVLGETASAMLLDSGDELYAAETSTAPPAREVWLQGWGAAMDAHHLTGPTRDGAGLARACAATLQRGNTAIPGLIVTHGTGTRYNDDSESAAYRTVAPGVPLTGWKGVLGHSLGACGVTEAVVCSAALSMSLAAPGTVGYRAGHADVLPPGAYVCHAPWLSPNAGFGGLNAAVLIGYAPPAKLLMVVPQCRARVALDLVGGALPELTSRSVTSRSDPSWGRMDLACRALVALGVQLGVRLGAMPSDTAVVLLTTVGSAATDRAYEIGRRAGTAAAQMFVYTLPTTPIGELSIRCQLQGPGMALLGATDDEGHATVAGLLAEGHTAVVLARVEADTLPHTAWAEYWTA